MEDRIIVVQFPDRGMDFSITHNVYWLLFNKYYALFSWGLSCWGVKLTTHLPLMSGVEVRPVIATNLTCLHVAVFN